MLNSLSEFSERDAVGLWIFSDKLDGKRDFKDLVPIGQIGEDNRRARIEERVKALAAACRDPFARPGWEELTLNRYVLVPGFIQGAADHLFDRQRRRTAGVGRRDGHGHPVAAGQLPIDPVERPGPVERAGLRLLDAQVEQVPAEALDDPRALAHQVLPVVDQQAQVALGTIQPRDREVRLAQRGAGAP